MDTGEIFQKIDEYFQKNELDTAKIFIQEEISKNPDNILLYTELARTQLALGEVDQATSNLEKALEKDQNNPTSYYYLALIASMKEDYKQALRLIDQAITIDTESSDLYNFRGLTLVSLEDYELAIRSFRSALKLNQEAPTIHYNLGRAFALAQRYHKAKDSFTRAIDLNPNFPEFYYERAMAEASLSQFEDAIEDTQQAHQLNPENPIYKLSYLSLNSKYLSDNKQYKEAIPFLEELASIDPSTPNVYNLVKAYNNIDENETAIELLNLILEQEKEHAPLLLEKANILSKTGKTDEAIEYYQKFIRSVKKNNIEEYQQEAKEMEQIFQNLKE